VQISRLAVSHDKRPHARTIDQGEAEMKHRKPRQSGIDVRPASEADVPDLVRLRRMMFEAMGVNDSAHLDALDAAAEAYFAEAVPGGSFQAWLAVTSTGLAVGAGGVVIDQHPPSPGNLSGQVGTIMNLVTDPHHRRCGIARRIMEVIIKWLAEQGIQWVSLHATGMGRPLYEELGFVESNEMRLVL
jgi:GNAT superfamily N-acetyltransferase